MKSNAWLNGVEDRLRKQMMFLIEIDRLKNVVRGNRIADASRRENTAEHSWHLALFALVLQEHAVDEVDITRVVQMLLIHDLVEIECGDTPPFDAQGALQQADRERLAADKLFGCFQPIRASRYAACGRNLKQPRHQMHGSPRRSTGYSRFCSTMSWAAAPGRITMSTRPVSAR